MSLQPTCVSVRIPSTRESDTQAAEIWWDFNRITYHPGCSIEIVIQLSGWAVPLEKAHLYWSGWAISLSSTGGSNVRENEWSADKRDRL